MRASGIRGITTASKWVNRGLATSADFMYGDLTVDAAWHDLDLSGIVPAGATFVEIQVVAICQVAFNRIEFREKDLTTEYATYECYVQVSMIPIAKRFWIPIDANGMIEYYVTVATWPAIAINVKAWILPGS